MLRSRIRELSEDIFGGCDQHCLLFTLSSPLVPGRIVGAIFHVRCQPGISQSAFMHGATLC